MITWDNLTISFYYIYIIVWYFPGAWLDTQTFPSSLYNVQFQVLRFQRPGLEFLFH